MTGVYIRLYKAAMTSGLIRELGDERWTTLCILALHMKPNGRCYPTQEQVAKFLGISRQQVNTRIKRLLDFSFQGQPVVELIPDDTRRNNTYRILPLAQLAIFEGEVESLDVSSRVDTQEDVSSGVDTDMSNRVDTYMSSKVDTNNNHINNKQNNNNNTSHTMTVVIKNSPDVVKYFCQKYREAYFVDYSASYKKDASMVKNKLIPHYSMEQIKNIIDVTFQEYDRAWATKGYPRPTIGQLVTWIPNKALAIVQEKEKKQAEIKKAMEAPRPTAEEIIARMRRGLKK